MTDISIESREIRGEVIRVTPFQPDPARMIHPVLRGISNANDAYQRWSGEYWLSDAGIENVMQTHVAETCHQELRGTTMRVHPEASYEYFYSRTGDARRADIMISCEGDLPLIHIELKRSQGGAFSDGRRIREVLITRQNRLCRDLKGAVFGAFVMRRTGQRRQSLEDMVEKVRGEFIKGMNTNRLVSQYDWRRLGAMDIKDDDKSTHWECAALAISVSRLACDE